ncbi:MAG: hypothetical protein IJE05_05780 [Clostridia bacterium]|nr:hypothetical protein [Clostridia bacterium]
MRKIGFIGAYDKTDMLLNIAKILTTLKNKVLIADSTINQKARYIVPAINPTVSYITSFEDIDIAIGFNSIEEIKNYTGISEELPYDIILIDADTVEKIEGFELETANKNYFVTSFDVYSLKRGIEILNGLKVPINLTKLLFAKEILKEDDDYLNFLAVGHKLKWDEEKIYFPIENGDFDVIVENQRVQKIKFKKLSIQYKDNLSYIAQQILDIDDDLKVRKAIKIIERGV